MSAGDIVGMFIALRKFDADCKEILAQNENVIDKLLEMKKEYVKLGDEVNYSSLHHTFYTSQDICNTIDQEIKIQKYRIPVFKISDIQLDFVTEINAYVKIIIDWNNKNKKGIKNDLNSSDINLLFKDWFYLMKDEYFKIENIQYRKIFYLQMKYIVCLLKTTFSNIDEYNYMDILDNLSKIY